MEFVPSFRHPSHVAIATVLCVILVAVAAGASLMMRDATSVEQYEWGPTPHSFPALLADES
ncbi:MAG TPA: hypothetical protein VFU99_04830 [Gaiellaceae bacterium]|nr:hypothetical protein [Gaiellaceae bacterium]